jgi:hypothetical protein
MIKGVGRRLIAGASHLRQGSRCAEIVAAGLLLTMFGSIDGFIGPTPAAAAEYPFVGTWDCEVATFTFTNRTYHNGTELMRFNRIDFLGRDFKLTFPKNYVITLIDPGPTTMTWLSSASGDSFNCKRK